MLGDKYFYISLENNLKWLAVSLAFPVVLGFLIAYAMRARAVYLPTLLRTAIFFPVTMSLVAVGLMFLLILNPIFGAFDSVLRAARPRAFWSASGSATIASRSTRSRSWAGGRSPGCR